MTSCEKCWRDAGGDADKYHALLNKRNNAGKVCTPEQQAGEGADTCPFCLRQTMHMHADVCMNKDCTQQ